MIEEYRSNDTTCYCIIFRNNDRNGNFSRSKKKKNIDISAYHTRNNSLQSDFRNPHTYFPSNFHEIFLHRVPRSLLPKQTERKNSFTLLQPLVIVPPNSRKLETKEDILEFSKARVET